MAGRLQDRQVTILLRLGGCLENPGLPSASHVAWRFPLGEYEEKKGREKAAKITYYRSSETIGGL